MHIAAIRPLAIARDPFFTNVLDVASKGCCTHPSTDTLRDQISALRTTAGIVVKEELKKAVPGTLTFLADAWTDP
jgi:hypothetical protein